MNRKATLITLAVLLACSITGYYLWYRFKPAKPKQKPFTTAQPTTTTIRHRIHANGIVKIKDSIRVGSLVSGLVKEILAEESDHITKNQLLAVIENGKSDTSIRIAQGAMMQAQATFDYVSAVYAREQELYRKGLRSDQEIEASRQQYMSAQGALMTTQAQLDVARIEFENCNIKAPEDGVIVAIGVKKGMRITTDLDATVLFEIAKDLTKMEAEFSLEESAAGHVKRGQKISFTVDNHPYKKFKAIIKNVSYAPMKTSHGLMYRATADIDNSAQLLRPGMTLHATIKVAKKKDAIGVENVAFYLDPLVVATVAKTLGYTIRPISAADKKELNAEHRTVKYVWVHDGKMFIEKAVETGLYDDRYIETLSGLEATEHYLADVFQANVMDDHYKKMFKGAL